jgi:hypothetical protein
MNYTNFFQITYFIQLELILGYKYYDYSANILLNGYILIKIYLYRWFIYMWWFIIIDQLNNKIILLEILLEYINHLVIDVSLWFLESISSISFQLS